MAPSPVTPSPYRFISKPHPPSKPNSSLRKAQSAQQLSPQFAATPRFTVRPTSSHEDDSLLPSTSPLAARVRPPTWQVQRREEIEDNANSEDDGDAETEDEQDVIPSIERVCGNEIVTHNDLPTAARPRKRRRSPSTGANRGPIYDSDNAIENDNSSDDNASAASEDPHPSLVPHQSLTAPRFHFAIPLSTPAPAPVPHFVLPTPVPASLPAPLPEVFSPHRRGAKYLPAGLAATCREWVLSAAQLGAGVRRAEGAGLGGGEEAEWAARVEVVEVGGGEGMLLVRGAEAGERWMLLGGGSVAKGKVVGVKRPVWEVEVQGEVWGVGVEWRVLGEG